MGLFDGIKKKIGAAADDYKEAYNWAMQQDIAAICDGMKEAKGMTLSGYKAVLREKCEELKTSELKELYNEVTGRNKPGIHIDLSLKTNHAAETIANILVERGVFSRDENGCIVE